MALIIEDGTIVANADSYITVAEYNAWADARFGARSTAPNCDEDTEALILRAMDYFETLAFVGFKSISTQALQWPRDSVYIDNYYVTPNEIPKEVKTALYELSYAEEAGTGELNEIERKVTSEKVGSIAVTYDKSSSRGINVAPSLSMRKLLRSGGSGFVVSRA